MNTTDPTSSTSTEGPALYHEMSGAGPVALLVPGTPGDGGQFAALSASLGASHTVVSYDRRGTSRSPRPSGWSTTSVAEQADDAAAVIAQVTSEPALVYGRRVATLLPAQSEEILALSRRFVSARYARGELATAARTTLARDLQAFRVRYPLAGSMR